VRDYALADAVQVPATCWAMAYPPVLVPFRVFLLEDAVRNTLMYLPLVLVLGLLMRSSGYIGYVRALLVVLGVSMAFEVAQLFVASRFPAIDDVIFNTAGGSLGLALAQGLARRATRHL
jgi:glycopeptide antibiotics resistance protein